MVLQYFNFIPVHWLNWKSCNNILFQSLALNLRNITKICSIYSDREHFRLSVCQWLILSSFGIYNKAEQINSCSKNLLN